MSIEHNVLLILVDTGQKGSQAIFYFIYLSIFFDLFQPLDIKNKNVTLLFSSSYFVTTFFYLFQYLDNRNVTSLFSLLYLVKSTNIYIIIISYHYLFIFLIHWCQSMNSNLQS